MTIDKKEIKQMVKDLAKAKENVAEAQGEKETKEEIKEEDKPMKRTTPKKVIKQPPKKSYFEEKVEEINKDFEKKITGIIWAETEIEVYSGKFGRWPDSYPEMVSGEAKRYARQLMKEAMEAHVKEFMDKYLSYYLCSDHKIIRNKNVKKDTLAEKVEETTND